MGLATNGAYSNGAVEAKAKSPNSASPAFRFVQEPFRRHSRASRHLPKLPDKASINLWCLKSSYKGHKIKTCKFPLLVC